MMFVKYIVNLKYLLIFVGKTKKNQTKKRFFILLFLNIWVLYLAPGVELI
jgi:hypothetical protein